MSLLCNVVLAPIWRVTETIFLIILCLRPKDTPIRDKSCKKVWKKWACLRKTFLIGRYLFIDAVKFDPRALGQRVQDIAE